MKQQVPGWVIGLFLIGLAAILLFPPWEYNPPFQKAGDGSGFKGWHAQWFKTPEVDKDRAPGVREQWSMKTPYIVGEILILGVIVFGAASVLTRKGDAPQMPDAPPPAEEQAPPPPQA